MATTTVAAAGTALALYYYSRRKCAPGNDAAAGYETHTTAHSAPRSFLEDLYFFAEGLRYTYGETLGRWRTADLLIGLAYLCRKEPEEHPLADVARQGRLYGQGLAGAARTAALEELSRIERFFRYCSGLRERRPVHQRKNINQVLGVADEDILRQELRAGVLKPSYILTRDTSISAIVLAVRGTHSFKDAFTSLTGASKPHHVVDSNNVVLGYSHFGMLAAARWLKEQLAAELEAALVANPGYKLYIVGHSLGGGTAAMLTMMLREGGGVFAGATCVAIACPACMTLELARSCAGYVTTIVNGCDVIPTICPATADALRIEVMRSSWFQEFRSDVRSSSIVRAVEGGIRGVGSATATATSWTTSRLFTCVQRRPARPQLKRRNSDDVLDLRGCGSGDEGNAASEHDSGKDRGAAAHQSTSAPERGSPLADMVMAAPTKAGQPGGAQSAADWVSLARFSSIAQSVTSFSGRQAQSLGRSVSAVSESASRLAAASSSKLISRVWGPAAAGPAPDGGGRHESDDGEDGGDAAEEGDGALAKARRRQSVAGGPRRAAAAAAALAEGRRGGAPEQVEMDLEFDRFESMEAEAGGSGGGAGGGLDNDGSLLIGGSLEAEASVRMAEVAEAVSAAEAEERAAGAAGQPHVPSIFRPGGYGSAEGGAGVGRSTQAETAWRRSMYPAGRIMHLVPARLVPGMALASGGAGQECDEWPEARMEEGDDYPASPGPGRKPGQRSPQQVGMAATAAAWAAGAGAAAQAGAGSDRGDELSFRDMASPWGSRELSMHDMVSTDSPSSPAGEPAAAAATLAAAAAAHPVEQRSSIFMAGAAEAEDMVLLEGVPQEAYARIKLCRSVLADHVIPCYLRSLESALQRI